MRSVLGLNLDEARYIIFDIETTGGNPEKNRITEIFAIRYFQDKIEDTFHSLVNPKIPVPRIVARMTGLTNAILKDAPLIKEVMPEFLTFIGKDILVSHNTIGDLKFIRHFALETANHDASNFFLCTHLLVEKLFPETPKKSLGGVADYFDIKFHDDSLHRAEADAYLTLGVFKRLFAELKAKGIRRVHEGLRYQADFETLLKIGWGIPPRKLYSVPAQPGLLTFLNRDKTEIFRTHSFNMKSETRRIQSWAELPKNTLRAVSQAYDYQYQITRDIFAAFLLESQGCENNHVAPAHIYHGRQVLCINLVREPQVLRLEYGPIKEGSVYSAGPVGDVRLVRHLFNHLVTHFGGSEQGKTLEFPLGNQKTILTFLEDKPFLGFLGIDRVWQQLKVFVKNIFSEKHSLEPIKNNKRGSSKDFHWQKPQWILQELLGILVVDCAHGLTVYFIVNGIVSGKEEVDQRREGFFADTRLQEELTAQMRIYYSEAKRGLMTKSQAGEANALMWMLVSRSGRKRSFFVAFGPGKKTFDFAEQGRS